VSKGLRYDSFRKTFVLESDRRSIYERKSQSLKKAIALHVELDINGRGAYVRGVAVAALHEFGDGGQLFLGSGRGYVTGVEEESEKGGLARTSTSHHEGVAVGGSACVCSVGGPADMTIGGVAAVEACTAAEDTRPVVVLGPWVAGVHEGTDVDGG
jgi:hypothetical protein